MVRHKCLSALLLLAILGCSAQTNAEDGQTSGYAGSQSCMECHEKFYQLWSTSYHGLAMQPYTAGLAQKSLTPQAAEVKIGKFSFHADILGSKGFVRERGPGGEKKYRIEQALGGKNVYYFLTSLERGRLQALPIAYDVQKKSGSTPLPAAYATSREEKQGSRSSGKTRRTPSTPPATAAM